MIDLNRSVINPNFWRQLPNIELLIVISYILSILFAVDEWKPHIARKTIG